MASGDAGEYRRMARIGMRLQILLLALVLSACATLPENLVKSPSVTLSNVEIVGFGFNGQTFLLSFDVENPNPFALPVRSIDYGLKLDGQRFASGETASDFTIPASGNTSFAISVDLNLLQSAPQLLSIVRDAARRELAYELDGHLGVDIPLTPPIKYHNSGTIRLNSGSH
jgi:LEA14-like dessication related protein